MMPNLIRLLSKVKICLKPVLTYVRLSDNASAAMAASDAYVIRLGQPHFQFVVQRSFFIASKRLS